MGIKKVITQDELPLKYKEFNLIETKDGLTHSVYLLGHKYVLKIVENATQETILSEQKLLENIKELCVPKLLDIFQRENCTMVFYSQLPGKSVLSVSNSHIEQIALFLKEFHTISKDLHSSNEKTYDKKYLENLINQTDKPEFLNYFNTLNITLENHGVIHGDLFCDNAKFEQDTLSGVYDFIEACEGDFIFELAVVAISWCFKDEKLDSEKVQVLLSTYDCETNLEDFKEYIKYALLYYITTRYINNRDYKELLKRLKNL